MPSILVNELQSLREAQERERAALGDFYADHDLVFAQPNGRPLHADNISQRDFRVIAKDLKLPRMRFYDLRHCHGTYLADQKTPIKEVQEQMGHSHPTVTLKYYVHSVPRTRQQAVNRLARRLIGRAMDREAGSGNSRE